MTFFSIFSKGTAKNFEIELCIMSQSIMNVLKLRYFCKDFNFNDFEIHE